MITLHGTSISKGIVIAEAAVIGPGGDLSGLPTELFHRGIQALKRNMPDSEKPEVVVVCDSLQDGLAARLPGIKVAAVAAQSPPQTDDCPLPCVADLDELLQSVADGDIMIVDATDGVVYVDPEVGTLVRYQSIEEEHSTKRLFLESVHLPAMTLSGHTVLVFCTVTDPSGIPSALEEGADGLLISASAVAAAVPSDWANALYEAGGKPLILMAVPDGASIKQLMRLSLPMQVTVAVGDQDDEAARLKKRFGNIAADLVYDGIEAAEIGVALLVPAGSPAKDSRTSDASRLIFDATTCDTTATQAELAECIGNAVALPETGDQPSPATVMLASSIDAVQYLLSDRIDSVATPPGAILATKNLIRSYPVEEQP